MKHDPIMSPRPVRAFVLFRSGGWLDLINPRSDCWTDEDPRAWASRASADEAALRGGMSPSLSLSTACWSSRFESGKRFSYPAIRTIGHIREVFEEARHGHGSALSCRVAAD